MDVFDSFFMRYGIKKRQYTIIKRIVYAPCDKVIVTDEARKGLMPDFLQKKLIVLPNYPFRYHGPISKSSNEKSIRILFFGWLGMNRGGAVAKGLLENDKRIRLIMLGWFADEDSRLLSNHPRAEYRGVVSQQMALEIAASEVDYILCLYEPRNNLNIVYASPNKVYDSIHTETPLIINPEVKIASLVEDLNIGIVLPSYHVESFKALTNEMINKLGTYNFTEDLKKSYAWESVQGRLLLAHEL
ncbi:hypothetical protein [Robiginitalea aurantiaca]|uniref:hypothetical protein n=1 Tax=Robiginitalea aurantiaca TaxID=3056915 RepID=UPI0025A9922A|nr:hypothetical protein [Robiginitalea aurantiaca]